MWLIIAILNVSIAGLNNHINFISIVFPIPAFFYRMAFPYVRLCPRHMRAGLQVCWYATLSKASRPQEKSGSDPVFQYVGQHKKPTHKVFVWGFSFTGALGIPTFVVPDSGRKKPRKYQLTPYRLETAEQVKSAGSMSLMGWASKDLVIVI